MIAVVVIILAMIGMGTVVWVGQACKTVSFAQSQLNDAWQELKAALEARREMVPYIVAVVPAKVAPDLDVLGNACDLCANVTGIRDCSLAEARLSAALARLFAKLDADPSDEARKALAALRVQLKDHDMKIAILKDLYDQQAELFNALQKQGSVKVLVSLGFVKPAELF